MFGQVPVKLLEKPHAAGKLQELLVPLLALDAIGYAPADDDQDEHGFHQRIADDPGVEYEKGQQEEDQRQIDGIGQQRRDASLGVEQVALGADVALNFVCDAVVGCRGLQVLECRQHLGHERLDDAVVEGVPSGQAPEESCRPPHPDVARYRDCQGNTGTGACGSISKTSRNMPRESSQQARALVTCPSTAAMLFISRVTALLRIPAFVPAEILVVQPADVVNRPQLGIRLQV